MTIKEISYKDERLGFFADQRKLVQKRYDRLEKQIKPDEPYTSERREFLSDLGRELSFYNDIIAMLENEAASKNEIVEEIFEEIGDIFREFYEACSQKSDMQLKEILYQCQRFVINEMWHKIAELKKKYKEGEK